MHIDFLSTIPVIATVGCLTRAAEILDVSPSTIHKRLKKVEDYYNLVIFTKKNQQLELTMDGKSFLDDINRITKLNETIVNRRNNKQKSSIHIGINLGVAIRVSREIISDFMKENPSVSIKISTILGSESIRYFSGDFVITTIPFNNSDYHSYVIDEVISYFSASFNYLEEFGEPETIEDLKNHNIILTPLERYDDQFLYCENTEGEKIKFLLTSSIFADTKPVSNEFVAAGNGIGLVPHKTMVSNKPLNIKALFNGNVYSKSLIQVCYKKNISLSHHAHKLMDCLTSKFSLHYT